MAEWLYTNVLHEPRKALGISVLEYCVLDYIYKTQTHPIYGKNGWTNAGCHRVAAFFDLSSGTVKKLFDRMDEAGLLERVADDMKRATEKFYLIAYESDVQKVNDYRLQSEQQGVQKVNSNRSKSEHYNKKNKIEIKKEYKELQKENSILVTINDQVDETAVKVVEIVNPYASELEALKNEYDALPKVDVETAMKRLKEVDAEIKTSKRKKYIYPPTIEELVQPIYEKLLEKKRLHPNIVDCWNWANHQAEAFWLYQDKMGWKVEKLNGAIATWINKAIQYKTVVVPCPIQYKGNPANAQPQPTKVHVEETKSPEQSKEARKAMFAAAKAELNQIGA